MATLYVKDVPEPLYRALKDRAKKEGRSISAEVRKILEAAVPPRRSQKEVIESIERIQARIAEQMKGRWLDPGQSIRDDRDSR
jgi:plasmid stability protein